MLSGVGRWRSVNLYAGHLVATVRCWAPDSASPRMLHALHLAAFEKNWELLGDHAYVRARIARGAMTELEQRQRGLAPMFALYVTWQVGKHAS